MAEILSDIVNHDWFGYGLTLIAGVITGYLVCRWRIDSRKENIKTKLEFAQSHLDSDFHEIGKSVDKFWSRLEDFADDFDEFKQEIQEKGKNRHVSKYLDESRSDIAKLSEED